MQAIYDFLKKYPIVEQIGRLILSIFIAFFASMILLRIMSKLFRKFKEKRNGMNTHMLENICRFVIIFVSIILVFMSNDLTKSFGQTLFQGTAVLAAIAGFAAQNVLADFLCGLILSTTKPFEIGDRIELDDGLCGVVKDLTLRHVVLQGLDSQVYIVPNSKMNARAVRNMSYHTTVRSVDFRFQVAYGTDTDLARSVIRQAIMDSPFSVPGRDYGHGEKEYAEVYFLAYKESSLEMGTTAYYEPTSPTEVFKNDINTRVKKALEKAGIEIPYPYVSVQMSENA